MFWKFHGNKLAFWYINTTSDIQIHGIFTDLPVTKVVAQINQHVIQINN